MPKYKVTDPQTGRSFQLTGDSPPTEEELTQVFSSASNVKQATPVAQQNPLEKIIGAGRQAVKFFQPALEQVGTQIGTGLALGGEAGQLTAETGRRSADQARMWVQQAQQETNPTRKRALLDAAKAVSQTGGQAATELVSGAEQQLGLQPGGQVASPLRSGAAFALETGATLAPGAPKGSGALQRILSAAGIGGLRGGAVGASQGLLNAEAGAGEIAQQAASGAGTGAALAGALQGGGELLKGITGALKGTGTNLIASQYNVPRGVAGQNKLKDTIDQLADYNVTTLDQVDDAANRVTGSNGVITRLTRESVANADNVPISTSVQRTESFNRDALSLLDDSLGITPASRSSDVPVTAIDVARNITEDPSLPLGQDKKLLKEFERDLFGFKPPSGPDNIGKADPTDVFDLIKKYEKKSSDLLRYRPERSSGPNANDEALGRAYKLMADELKDRLFIDAGANNVTASIAEKSALVDELKDISPKLVQRIKSAKTIGELRSIAAPFVRGDFLQKASQAGSQIATNNLGGVATGLGRLVQNPLNLLALPLSYGPLNAGVGQGLRQASGPAAAVASAPQTQQALELLQRLGVLGAVGSQRNQQ